MLSTGVSPVFISIKQPVPYVFFTSPRAKHVWPNRAACWSPAAPAMGISAPPMRAAPYTMLESQTLGSMHMGMSSSAQISLSHSSVWMLNSIVREALVTSVTWAAPPVSFQMSQVSTVPNKSSPRSARSRAPSTLSKIHLIFVALKYASMSRPVLALISSA